jgi:hypothetical protein
MEYLVVFTLPRPQELNVPAHLSPQQAREFAASLAFRQMQPVLEHLRQLQDVGAIAGFQPHPEQNAVSVTAEEPASARLLAGLPGVAGVMPPDEGGICAERSALALQEQVFGLSQARQTAGSRPFGVGVTSTDPSIDVYALTGSDWGYVAGYTTPDTGVTMRILRGGRVVATEVTTSDSEGYYEFYPDWEYCTGYTWTLRPGDRVEVTAHGSTVTTVVAQLSAWADPETNKVGGVTDAGRSVEIYVLNTSDTCSYSEYVETVSASGSGDFLADFTAQVDFDGRAVAIVYARDANGNSTVWWFQASHVSAGFDDSYFDGSLKPQANFTATLRRGSSTVSTYDGQAGPDGWYSGYFSEPIQPGDVIWVSSGSVSLSLTAAPFNVSLNPTTNQASGTTGAGRLVGAFFHTQDSGIVGSICSWDSACASTTADGGGNFTLNSTMDLVRGDYAYFDVFDNEGNYQYTGQSPIPAIVAVLAWGEVDGYWHTWGPLTVTLKDSGGSVRDIQNVYAQSWDLSFYAYMAVSINPTDRIEVTDGTTTETMTVQSLTARLDPGVGNVSGSSPGGHLLASLWDFRRDTGYYADSYCSETTASAGAYVLAFPGAQLGAQDDADVWVTGSDGHYTSRDASAFSVNVWKETNFMSGYTETPFASVTITLMRGGATIATSSKVSSRTGYYSASLGGGVAITQGDLLQVQTGDGDSVVLSIPELTLNEDAAGNRLYGRSPANEPVWPLLLRVGGHNWAYGIRLLTSADSGGDYSVSASGRYWWGDCSPMRVGAPCTWPMVSYYNAGGHQISLGGTWPPGEGPDSYEPDDTSAAASAYTSVQDHSFHQGADVDWTSFAVPSQDVIDGVSYLIETRSLGPGMDTMLYLYDTDGSTLLMMNDDSGGSLASRIEWTPPAPGTYFVKVGPYDANSTGYCGAVYDLMILPVRAEVFLPVILRNFP